MATFIELVVALRSESSMTGEIDAMSPATACIIVVGVTAEMQVNVRGGAVRCAGFASSTATRPGFSAAFFYLGSIPAIMRMLLTLAESRERYLELRTLSSSRKLQRSKVALKRRRDSRENAASCSFLAIA